jgi:hypothetical protein
VARENLFKQKTLARAATIFIIILGIVLIVISIFNISSFLAVFGISLLFWSAIFLYITPTKQVPIEMFYGQAEVTTSNIERIINESGMTLSAIYLPPKNLKNVDSNIVFIPKESNIMLPCADEINNNLITNRKDGVLIVPPGAALCKFFEHELNASFVILGLKRLQAKLPKLLVNDMELAENVEIQSIGNTVILEISGSLFDECRQTDFQLKTHKQIGCLLSSAIACALAKAAGKPVIIQNEIHNKEQKTTHVTYRMIE